MPRTGSRGFYLDRSVLEAALAGFEAQRSRIDGYIAEVKATLRGRRGLIGPGISPMPRARKMRTMSAAGRKRIAAAQKKRWAAWRKKQK